MKKLLLFISISLLFVTFFGCKKTSTDTKKPSITVIAPAPGDSFQMFDTIAFSLQVSDNKIVTQIEVTLQDENGHSMQNALIIPINVASANLNYDYILYEYRIPTGDYSLNFLVSDGTNIEQKQIPIHITESPTEKKGFYFVAKGSNSHTYLRTDTVYTTITNYVHSGAYIGSAISNYNQQLYTASGPDQLFRAYDISNNSIGWSMSNASTGPTITACKSDQSNVYLGKSDGNVYKYNSYGTIVKMYNTLETNYFVEHVFCTDDYVIASLSQYSVSPAKKTVVFENATGIIKKVIDFKETKAAFQKSSNEIFFVSNRPSGEGVVEVLALPGGNMYQSYSFGNTTIYSACQVNNNTLYISTAAGSIYQYNYSGTNVIAVQNGIQAKQLSYSAKFNELYASENKNFMIYDAGNFTLTQKSSVTLSDTIAAFEVIFNK